MGGNQKENKERNLGFIENRKKIIATNGVKSKNLLIFGNHMLTFKKSRKKKLQERIVDPI